MFHDKIGNITNVGVLCQNRNITKDHEADYLYSKITPGSDQPETRQAHQQQLEYMGYLLQIDVTQKLEGRAGAGQPHTGTTNSHWISSQNLNFNPLRQDSSHRDFFWPKCKISFQMWDMLFNLLSLLRYKWQIKSKTCFGKLVNRAIRQGGKIIKISLIRANQDCSSAYNDHYKHQKSPNQP